MNDFITPEIIKNWWSCAKGGAAGKKAFENDPRSEDEIANDLMNDWMDKAIRAKEAP